MLVGTTVCVVRARVSIYNIYSFESFIFIFIFIYVYIYMLRLTVIRSTCYLQFLVTVATLGIEFNALPRTTGAGDMQNTVRSRRTSTRYTPFGDHAIRTLVLNSTEDGKAKFR